MRAKEKGRRPDKVPGPTRGFLSPARVGYKHANDHDRGGGRMDDRTQKLLLTALSVGLSALLSRPFTNTIYEAIPQRRGVRDDVAEAVLKGTTRAVAVIVASVLVRWLAGRRG